MLDSFARFALQGAGTPAPLFPTRHLVTNGLYRQVRNPMYLAIVSAIVGQGLLLGNLDLPLLQSLINFNRYLGLRFAPPQAIIWASLRRLRASGLMLERMGLARWSRWMD